jgi:hypothetical protein
VDSQEQVERAREESKIRFFPPTIWTDDLKNVLDLDRALSRYVYQSDVISTDESFMVEERVDVLEEPGIQSVEDLSDVVEEKELPLMWFPRKCRHGYQVIEGTFHQKLAYIVAIREVSFHRRRYATQFDEPYYQEPLVDEMNVDSNDFVQNGDVWQIEP